MHLRLRAYPPRGQVCFLLREMQVFSQALPTEHTLQQGGARNGSWNEGPVGRGGVADRSSGGYQGVRGDHRRMHIRSFGLGGVSEIRCAAECQGANRTATRIRGIEDP